MIAQRLADRNVPIEGHHQENIAVHHDDEVEEEHLNQAANESDVVHAKEEAKEHLGQYGGGATNVGDGQQRDKDVHGGMQSALLPYCMDDETVGKYDDYIKEDEWDEQETSEHKDARKTEQCESMVRSIDGGIPEVHHDIHWIVVGQPPGDGRSEGHMGTF